MSFPVAADGSDCVSLKTPVQPPQQLFSTVFPAELVSPVSSKKNWVNLPSGRNIPFSGRLKGVPSAATAAAFALNEAVPFAVSWIVIQRVSNDWPYVCSATWSGDMTGAWDALVIGVCEAFSTWRTCSLPCARSPGAAGT